jgi:hypothetical protein
MNDMIVHVDMDLDYKKYMVVQLDLNLFRYSFTLSLFSHLSYT